MKLKALLAEKKTEIKHCLHKNKQRFLYQIIKILWLSDETDHKIRRQIHSNGDGTSLWQVAECMPSNHFSSLKIILHMEMKRKGREGIFFFSW